MSLQFIEARLSALRMKIGIIGTGWVAQKHLGALQQIDAAEVVAIAGRNQARAHELAAPFGATIYESYLPMLERESLDAVFILLPPHLHGAVERACAEHVGAVLIEKPIALSLEAAQSINAHFKTAGTLVSVGYMNRYRASVQRARACLTPGHAGGSWPTAGGLMKCRRRHGGDVWISPVVNLSSSARTWSI